MSALFFFNPENDLALATNSPFFTPPAAALQLRCSGAALIAWLGNAGDFFLGRQQDHDWMTGMGNLLDIKFPSIPADFSSIEKCHPWGWSLYARRQLQLAGVESAILPDDNTLERLRMLSHRRITIKIHQQLNNAGLPYSLHEAPVECRDVAEIETRLGNGEQRYIKSPWSGSGRGIVDSKSAPLRQVTRLARGVIGHQGSVLVEQSLEKIQDFAMLYDMNNGKAVFRGYSLFYNSGYSAYSGNILCDDSAIKSAISQYVPYEWLTATEIAVGEALENVIGTGYSGPIGVDMLIYKTPEGYNIAPCIEVNMRMTMGRLAHHLNDNFIVPGRTGEFRLEMLSPQRYTELMEGLETAVIENHRLLSGTLPLTPPDDNRFCFTMTVK